MSEWDRLPNEPPEWYRRFVEYCALGSTRSLSNLWVAECLALGRTPTSRKAPHDWFSYGKRFRWKQRAAAWDADAAEMGAIQQAAVEQIAHQRRLDIIHRLIGLALAAISAAELDKLEPSEARRLLSQARLTLRDMLAAERLELTSANEGATKPLELTASDLREAERRRARFYEQLGRTPPPVQAFGGRDWPQAGAREDGALAGGAVSAGGARPARAGKNSRRAALPTQSPSDPRGVLCVGSDPALAIDLAALRAVCERHHFYFHRVEPASRVLLAEHLSRARARRRPVRFVHLALHGSDAGVQFADGLAEGEWLSSILSGVEVLVIAACSSSRLGDWLGVVPYVVTFSAELPHGDAAIFTQAFWSGIASGRAPAAALDGALERCGSEVREMIVRHW
jgi:hypothetical protein